jgi:glycosyltransferase involved in cell wall biosynthesis
MRVLVIEPAGQLWGSERALLDMIESVAEIEFAVCCPPDGPLLQELLRRGTRALPYFISELHRKSRWRRLVAVFGVLRAIFAFRPDVLHVNQAGAYRVALSASRPFHIPVVCHVRLFEDVSYLAARRPNPERLKSMIAISGAVAEEIASFPALAAIPVHKLYDAYQPVSLPETPGRRKQNLIVCAGRIAAIKGQEVLISALAHSSKFPPGTECLIAGNGESSYIARLKQKASESEDVAIKWLGFIEDIFAVLRSAGVLACPSHREPLGRVVFEAWNAGAVPVVFAGAGGSAEIVAAADGGLVYDEQTPECLAHALSKAMALECAEKDRLIANGRAWMKKECAPEQYGRAVAAVLERACT